MNNNILTLNTKLAFMTYYSTPHNSVKGILSHGNATAWYPTDWLKGPSCFCSVRDMIGHM